MHYEPCFKLGRVRFREGGESPSCQVVRVELNTEPSSASLLLLAASTLVHLTKLGMRPARVRFWAFVSPDFPQPSASLFKVSQGSPSGQRASWKVSSSLSSFACRSSSHADNVIGAIQHDCLTIPRWVPSLFLSAVYTSGNFNSANLF